MIAAGSYQKIIPVDHTMADALDRLQRVRHRRAELIEASREISIRISKADLLSPEMIMALRDLDTINGLLAQSAIDDQIAYLRVRELSIKQFKKHARYETRSLCRIAVVRDVA